MNLLRKEEIPIGLNMGGRVDFSTVPQILIPGIQYQVNGKSGDEFLFSASKRSIELSSLRAPETYIMKGEVDLGILSWTIFTRDEKEFIQHPDLNGTDFYNAAFLYFSTVARVRISTILGVWQSGSNFKKYRENRAKKMDVQTSALATWAGRMASEHGYSRVVIPSDSDQDGFNEYRRGYVLEFIKP